MPSPDWHVIDHPRYKYALKHAYNHSLHHFEPLNRYRAVIEHDGIKWVELCGDGLMHIKRGYAWDGASGPAVDTMSIAAASLVHDAGYQLIAAGELPMRPWKAHFDREFYRLMRADRVPRWRAWYAYLAVRIFGRARDRYVADGLRLLSGRGDRK